MFEKNSVYCQDCAAMKSSTFHILPEKDLVEVDSCRVQGHYGKGDLLFQAGEKADFFYCIMKGSVQLFRNSPNREQSFAIVGPGTWAGYRDALANSIYEHNARALTPVVACRVEKKVLHTFIEKYPSFSAAILKDLSEGWIESERQSYNLGARKTVERLADFLLGLASDYHPQKKKSDLSDPEVFTDRPIHEIKASVKNQSTGPGQAQDRDPVEMGEAGGKEDFIEVDFPLTRETVATLIGTTTESVIRTLSDFRARGWIEFSNGKIRIKNEKELSKLVRES